MKKLIAMVTAVSMLASVGGVSAMAAESGAEPVSSRAAYAGEELAKTTITVFAAKSLNSVMGEMIAKYNEFQPEVEVLGSYDSSGTLMTQIEEGAACDVFFSAAQKQMNELADKELIVPETRANIVNNQVCVVTYKDSGTAVTGLDNLGEAKSFALADGSVPVGKYTRQALVNNGTLAPSEDVSKITTQEVSEALGGIEINECINVGAVTAAVAEGSNEVGTVYFSDTYGHEEDLVILEKVPYELTGAVIYPAAQVVNPEADEAECAAAADFVSFLTSAEAQEIFDAFYFDTQLELK